MSEKQITFAEAIGDAMAEEMRRDEMVFLIGEDVRSRTYSTRSAEVGLWQEFGDWRIINSPISESAFVGASTAAAATGMRPIVYLMFSDFMYVAMDQIVNQTAKMRYMFGGKAKVPIVFRASIGAGRSAAAQHSQSAYSVFLNIPGLKNVVPSTPYDAKGLLKTAIRDDNPVLFFEHAGLMSMKDTIPDHEYLIPFGKADVKKVGSDITIVAIGMMVHKALSAAATLLTEKISVEVIDPRTLVPFDKKTLLESIKKTRRLLLVDECPQRGSAASEIAAIVAEEAFHYLDAPIKRIGAPNTPVPFSPPLEQYYLPNETKIIEAVKQIISYDPK
jgi:pyruvate dehydrogenase E1 component beta subunit